MNNKVYTAMKVSSFMANYRRELRMGEDIRKKEKVEKTTEFVERMKKVYEEAGVALKKVQKDMKRQADRGRKETEDWQKGDIVFSYFLFTFYFFFNLLFFILFLELGLGLK